MSDQQGPPIETLSDITWARVERDLWTRLDNASPTHASAPTTRRWARLAVPLVAAAAIAIIVVATQDSAPALIADNGLQRVVAGAAPTTISSNDAHILVEAETAIVLDRDTAKPRVVVERGAAWFTVTPRDAHHPFSVVAGDAIVQVIGTRFRVGRSAEHVDVEVEHGLVRVMFRGNATVLGDHQRWSSDDPMTVEAITSARAADTDPVVSAATNSGATDNVAVPVRPTNKSITAPAPITNPTSAARSPDSGTLDAPVTASRVVTKVTPIPPAIGTAAVRPVDHEQIRFNQFTALEVRDPDAAITGYLELAQGTSKWVETALFAAGRLAADRHDHRAESLLENYLRRFPNGANVIDAKHLLAVLKRAR